MEENIKQYIGVATTAINDKNTTREIEVYCPTMMPFVSGQHGENTSVETSTSINDINKGNIVSKIKTSDTITCEYLGSEAYTDVPDIHIGERVIVYNFLGVDKFYWIPVGVDENIRHTEHKRISVANQRQTKKTLSDDNSYFVELDTKYGKHIHIHTSTSDDETYGYDIIIDAKKSTVTIKDTDKNYIELDSNNTKITLKNKDNSVVELKEKDISISALNVVDIKGNILNLTGKSIIDLKTNILNMKYNTGTATGNMSMSGGNVNIQGGALNISGKSGTCGHCTSHGGLVIFP